MISGDPLKYLWLIVKLILFWIYVIIFTMFIWYLNNVSSLKGVTKVAITDTKLYLVIVTLKTQDDAKLLQ